MCGTQINLMLLLSNVINLMLLLSNVINVILLLSDPRVWVLDEVRKGREHH